MTSLAERIAGPERCAAVLDGSPAAALRFGAWFVPLWRGVMAGDWLAAEGLRAWDRLTAQPKVMDWFADAGAGPGLDRQLPGAGPVGVMRIRAAPRRFFEPAEWGEGEAALVWTVAAGDPAEGIDMIAMDPRDPARWWRRTGAAALLGREAELFDLAEGARIRLHEHPLGWLAGGAAPWSFCALDWAAWETRELLNAIGEGRITAVCDSDDHAARLRALARPRRAKLTIEVARAPEPVAEAAE